MAGEVDAVKRAQAAKRYYFVSTGPASVLRASFNSILQFKSSLTVLT